MTKLLVRSLVVGTALGVVLFSTSACTEKNRFQAAVSTAPSTTPSVTPSTAPPSTPPAVTSSVSTPVALRSAASPLVEGTKPAVNEIAATVAVAPAQWSDIKNLTYDSRLRFYAGLPAVESAVDAQIAALVAKRATMTSATDTSAWDFAMKEMLNSRAQLRSQGEVMSTADAENWEQLIDRVELAWERTQNAYGKVRSSTTN